MVGGDALGWLRDRGRNTLSQKVQWREKGDIHLSQKERDFPRGPAIDAWLGQPLLGARGGAEPGHRVYGRCITNRSVRANHPGHRVRKNLPCAKIRLKNHPLLLSPSSLPPLSLLSLPPLSLLQQQSTRSCLLFITVGPITERCTGLSCCLWLHETKTQINKVRHP